LQDVSLLCHTLYVLRRHHFSDDGHSERFARFDQKIEPFIAKPLEAVWGRSWLEYSSAKYASAVISRFLRARHDLVSRFDRAWPSDDEEVPVTNRDTTDVNDRIGALMVAAG
jgi:hypothetical protein